MRYWSDIYEDLDSHTGVSKDWSDLAYDAAWTVSVVLTFWRIPWPSKRPQLLTRRYGASQTTWLFQTPTVILYI